jgi:hypothetical protein
LDSIEFEILWLKDLPAGHLNGSFHLHHFQRAKAILDDSMDNLLLYAMMVITYTTQKKELKTFFIKD